MTASSGGRHAATPALRAQAGRMPPGKLPGFEVRSLKVHLWTQQRHPDLPDALDGSSAFQSIVGTQHLDICIKNALCVHHHPHPLPLQLTAKNYGKFMGIQTPLWWGTGFPIPQSFIFSPSQGTAWLFAQYATNADVLS